MLKKVGIVTAAATAAVLAISPMAFAHDHHHHHRHHGGGNNQHGLIDLQNTNAQVPVQACNNSVVEGVLGILARGERNRDNHKGKCRLHNDANNGGHRHHHHH